MALLDILEFPDPRLRTRAVAVTSIDAKLLTLIEVLDDEREQSEEGCLSVPGYYETVERANHILVKALGRDGVPFTLEAKDLLAVCIQHELDHLEGKLFVDYVSPLKRNRIRKKLEKKHRQEELA